MITTFANYLTTNRGLSTLTVTAYTNALHEFAAYINATSPGTRWSTLTKGQIDAYVAHMVTKGSKPATIKQRISSLRTFYKTCIAMGAHIDNPARYVSTPKLSDELPKTIEIDAIRDALHSAGTDEQAKAIIAIIFETGIRLQELLDMRPADIDLQNKTIKINGKGSRERIVYFGELTQTYFIGKWQYATHTQRQCRHLVYWALLRHSKAKQLSPHALRHTFATTMLNNGGRLEAIGKLMGHKHTETTEIYARLGSSETRETYEKTRPRL